MRGVGPVRAERRQRVFGSRAAAMVLSGLIIGGGAATTVLASGPGTELDALLGAPVAEAELEAHRGQADLFQMQASRITEHAAVEGNVVENSPAGLNVIHEGAIRDLHGLSTVIQNSGHHVVIQEATNINVTVTP